MKSASQKTSTESLSIALWTGPSLSMALAFITSKIKYDTDFISTQMLHVDMNHRPLFQPYLNSFSQTNEIVHKTFYCRFSFIPCSSNIFTAVNDMAGLFPEVRSLAIYSVCLIELSPGIITWIVLMPLETASVSNIRQIRRLNQGPQALRGKT